MPASSYQIKIIKSFEEFSKIHSEQGKGTFWFRGHSNKNYTLIPSLYRKSPSLCRTKSCEEWFRTHFQARTLHMLGNQKPDNNLEWLALMQHHGLATRLLDWSENAATAFLFAVEKYFTKEAHDRGVLPCVWVLDPLKLNKIHRLRHIPNLSMMEDEDWRDKNLDRNKRKLEDYFLKGVHQCKDSYAPIAVLHPLNSERIRAQAGVFTLFPLYSNDDSKCNDPNNPCRYVSGTSGSNHVIAMEKLDACKKLLTKYIILHPERMYQDLKSMGLKRSMIYPEMEKISAEIEDFVLSQIEVPTISSDNA